MPRNRALNTIAILASLAFINTAQADINEPQGRAVQMLSSLQDSSQVRYFNADNWFTEETNIPSIAIANDDILNQNHRYLVDFSMIEDEEKKQQAKSMLRQQFGLTFDSDFLIISRYKGKLLFSPVDNEDDPNVSNLELSTETDTSSFARSENTATLPHVAFYLSVNRQITFNECRFQVSRLFESNNTERYLCSSSPNISLIYRVNLARSLQYGTTGSATPDAKIVRISLDDESSGAGINLNNKLDTVKATRWLSGFANGYDTEWVTDAIAEDYRFTFNASNSKAQVLKTFPRSNINSQYEVREISGFELGTSGGLDGAKGKLEASASYNQSRWLTFNTSDYRVERSSNGPRNITFKWNRDQFRTADSLLTRRSDTVFVWDRYPVDLNRISPISYSGFVPKMDVIYKANANETGTTRFTIGSSVNMRPFYHGRYYHYYFFGNHYSYHAFENTPRRRINVNTSFTVDWTHPVFTGGRPVNLQLASFNNRCIQTSSNGTLSARNCLSNSPQQSFIYDQFGRYVSAANKKCLDGESLDRLQPCAMKLSQRWEWLENSDNLKNIFFDQKLGHDKTTGSLGLYNYDDSQVSVRTMTSYTNLFN
ncbi:leukocidin family pore-forming toxin [Vibrio brasiliensis]|uniref:Hemolysin n=1 Tax=Vibrio brasiliensis LMG 20546 TaxID=945543 RepID=E8LTE9_9VIBR|nr:leukocidin family pore-forming toxin [Vibrio brasiliensis]EGA66042.1 hemolysin [Vibrio brasiliensis LMG 20546]MCG9647674.1 leukocidin family pore-forming toxin [Vibrio brasiliensis]MCG9726470.1 leukocidin family pore-forming toxin [Vibrio brasiliensis]